MWTERLRYGSEIAAKLKNIYPCIGVLNLNRILKTPEDVTPENFGKIHEKVLNETKMKMSENSFTI